MTPIRRRPPSSTRPPPANNLLAALPADEYARLAPTLGNISLKLKRFLHKPGEPIDQVYFPGGGFVSVVTVLKDGGMVEVATIGREGMLGMSAVSNGDLSPAASMVQAETDVCYTMSAKAFRQEMDRRGAFYDVAHAIWSGAGWIHHAVDRVQRRPLGRTTAVALVAAGT